MRDFNSRDGLAFVGITGTAVGCYFNWGLGFGLIAAGALLIGLALISR